MEHSSILNCRHPLRRRRILGGHVSTGLGGAEATWRQNDERINGGIDEWWYNDGLMVV